MAIVPRSGAWSGAGGVLGQILREPKVVALLLVSCLIGGFALTVIAATPEYTPHQKRHYEGTIGPLAEGQNALAVSGAAYDGMGFADARTTGLGCAVGIVFLTEDARQSFERGGDLPSPQLHCQRTTARLPGAIAAVYVENQGQNTSVWSFDLDLFRVSHPWAVYGLPAIALFLVSGLGIPLLLFERFLPKWMESIRPNQEESGEPDRQEEE